MSIIEFAYTFGKTGKIGGMYVEEIVQKRNGIIEYDMDNG